MLIRSFIILYNDNNFLNALCNLLLNVSAFALYAVHTQCQFYKNARFTNNLVFVYLSFMDKIELILNQKQLICVSPTVKRICFFKMFFK